MLIQKKFWRLDCVEPPDTLRLNADFRPLNQVTKKDPYTLPWIDKTIVPWQGLSGSRLLICGVGTATDQKVSWHGDWRTFDFVMVHRPGICFLSALQMDTPSICNGLKKKTPLSLTWRTSLLSLTDHTTTVGFRDEVLHMVEWCLVNNLTKSMELILEKQTCHWTPVYKWCMCRGSRVLWAPLSSHCSSPVMDWKTLRKNQ